MKGNIREMHLYESWGGGESELKTFSTANASISINSQLYCPCLLSVPSKEVVSYWLSFLATSAYIHILHKSVVTV